MSTLLYNPDRKDRQELIDEFVIRTETFNKIFRDLETGPMNYPEQHYLIIGQRGSGKTTLLTRLRYAVEDSAILNSWLIPISFSEEQYNISELANLWEGIAAELEDYHGFSGITEAMDARSTQSDFEPLALDILLGELDKRSKKVVLFIDNIGDLLKKFGDLEVRRLREVLQTKAQIRLIAGSAVVLESVLDYQQPLFEFFKTIQLKGLTNEESRTLLRKLATLHGETGKIENIIEKSPARIETLRQLSGGIPRTIVLLFNVFVDNEHGNAVSDLEKILDAVTPLYKHRMDDLPPQQQKIVDAVARNWDATSVRDLKERLRLESKVISAQLRQLEKNMVIEKRPTNTKNHLYLLRERFFNIWYLMRHGRKQDRQRVIWLVKFLEMWCDSNEIEERIDRYIQQVEAGKLNKQSLEFFGEVYSHFQKISPSIKLRFRQTVPGYVSNFIEFDEKEFISLASDFLSNKQWSSLAELTLTLDSNCNEAKRTLFELLENEQDLSSLDEIIRRAFLEDKHMVIKEDTSNVELPYIYFGYELFRAHSNLVDIFANDGDMSRFNHTIVGIYEALRKSEYDLELESRWIERFYTILLIFKQYNLVLSNFERVKSEEISARHKIIQQVARYLAADSSSDSINTQNEIIQKIIVDVATTIKEADQQISENPQK